MQKTLFTYFNEGQHLITIHSDATYFFSRDENSIYL